MRSRSSTKGLLAATFWLIAASACDSAHDGVSPPASGADAAVDGTVLPAFDSGADASIDAADAGSDAAPPDDASAGDASDASASDASDAIAAPFTASLTNTSPQGHQVTRFDTAGNAVDAHDGHIALFEGAYYLYGTSYGCGFVWSSPGSPFCGFKAYRSTDLVHWTDLGFLFDATTPTWQTRCNGSTYGCFRPHVVYNAHTSTYVLWINAYDNAVGYHVFTSASPAGPFVEAAAPILASMGNPGALTNGDHGLFVDDDGKAYLAYTSWSTGGRIAIEELDAAYLTGTLHDVTGITAGNTEAPSLFKRNGKYYLTYSDPNCGYCSGTGVSYVTATSPLGPWFAGAKISSDSCGGQPSFVAPLTSGSTTTYLFGSDLWTGAHNEATANFYWAPLTFSSSGGIDPIVCQASVTMQTIAEGAQAPAPANQDNSSGAAGFTSFCDVAGGVERAQTFTATRSGTLSSVSFTSFQNGNPTSGLEIDLYAADSSFLPTGTALSTSVAAASAIAWAPNKVVVSPNIQVVSGNRYAIVVKSATTAGCYGLEYKDASPFGGAGESYSNNHGVSFSIEPNRTLKFETFVGP